MATRTLTALYDRYEDAADTVRRLEAAGVPHADISLVSNDAAHSRHGGAIPAAGPEAHQAGAGAGASLGTLIGGGAGLLAGLGFLAIPGLGPVVAVGWLASILVGAGVGAAAGGIVGALTDIGVGEADAHAYAEGVGRGGTLLTVRTGAEATDRVGAILGHEGAVPMPEREGIWRGEGWGGRYIGRGAVTGTPVFTNPTMLAPAPGAPAVPAPDLAAAGMTALGATDPGAVDPAAGLLPPDLLGRGDRPMPASAGVRSETMDARGRVRIYDSP